MDKPEACGKCGAKPSERTERKRCPQCGSFEWVIEHGAHYMGGAREVFVCGCPAPNSALGRRKAAIATRQAARVKAGKRAYSNRPVTTPAMAKKAAEGLVRRLSPSQALRESGFPESTCQRGKKGINRMIRAEFGKLGRKYITMARDLTPEDQELLVRGMLFENVCMKTDKGVMAAKQLGADKRVSMWRTDSQVGVIVLQPPPVPKIAHEVPAIEPRYRQEEKLKKP